MTPIEVIKKARNILRRKEWCQHEMAYDKDGDEVAPNSKYVVQLCAVGAICRAVNLSALRAVTMAEDKKYNLAEKAIDLILREIRDSGDGINDDIEELSQFNDSEGVTKKDILNFFQQALERNNAKT